MPSTKQGVRSSRPRLSASKSTTLSVHNKFVPVAAASTAQAGESDSALLLDSIVKAIRKPGIDRRVVFGNSPSKSVFAYSALPSDPSKIVREDAQGVQVIGRFSNGRFKAISSRKSLVK